MFAEPGLPSTKLPAFLQLVGVPGVGVSAGVWAIGDPNPNSNPSPNKYLSTGVAWARGLW